MENLFKSIYKDRVVLVTGHTGFKGSWLVYWLAQMGAKVIGYSLEAPTNPNHIELLKLSIDSVKGDIRDQEKHFRYGHQKCLDQEKAQGSRCWNVRNV